MSTDRAEKLSLATPLPAEIRVGETLPPLEVRVMTSTEQFRDANGDPMEMPLLHGLLTT